VVTRHGTLLALLLLGAGVAFADDWPGPRAFVVFSESARYFVRFIPGESIGDTVGFAGAPKGKYATAFLYALQADRGYRLEHEITLTNPVLPLGALVANDGAFVTFDNWHNVGFGKDAAIYAPTGQLVRSWELTDLYAKEKLEAIPRSVSSRYWRCAPLHFVEPMEKSVYVPEALGGYFVFTLPAGRVAYTAGTRKECKPRELPLSWSTLGR
jgi:hypothetical protein